MTGTGRYLKSKNPRVQIIGSDPQGSILAEHWRVLEIIKEDCEEMKERYGSPRLTTIEDVVGDKHLEAVVVKDTRTGATRRSVRARTSSPSGRR